MKADVIPPDLQRAADQLFERLKYFTGLPLTKHNLHRMQEVVVDHARGCRLRGVKFPKLVPLVVEKIGGEDVGTVEWVRADLEEEGIQVTIYNLAVKYPNIRPQEIVAALARTFPHYRPGHFDLAPRERRSVLQ